jgi:hypothetical protein
VELLTDMVDVVFDTFGVDATYTPPGGAAIAVRVHPRRNDPVIQGLDTIGARSPGVTIEMQHSDVAARPVENGIIVIPADEFAGTYAVRDVQEDPHRLTWDCDVDRQ